MPEGQGFFIQRGWDAPRGRLENEDRSRWYGLRPGDIVTLKALDTEMKGLEVVSLHGMDNNGCTVRQGRREFKAVCEWCTVTRRVEDAR